MAKILLVEDDNNLREIYGARLGAEGYTIVSASDGEEALAIAVKEKPDLIISDVMMPRISGFDMLDILRNAPETKDTKIIMMTALSQAEDKARADKLGADMYLVKSQVTLEDVAKAVHDMLEPGGTTVGDAATGSTAPVADPAPAPANVSVEPAPSPVPEPEPETPVPDPNPAPVPEPDPGPDPVPAPTPPPEPDTDPEAEASEEVKEQPAEPAPALVEAKPVEPAVDETPKEESEPEKPPEVVLPDMPDEEKGAPQAKEAEPESPDKPEAVEAPKDEKLAEVESEVGGSSIGPSLAQALAEEEKTVEEQINNFDNSEVKAKEKPAEEPKPEPAQTAPPVNPLDDTPKKLVIQPSEEFLKGGPDLNELIEKEKAEEGVSTPPPASVVKPEPEQPAETPKDQSSATDKEPKDDLSKIAL